MATRSPVGPVGNSIHPLHLLAVVAAGGTAAAVAALPIRDRDIWWHVLLGREIRETGQVSGIGNDWAPFGDQTWTTTQWLSEVAYAALLDAAGWDLVVLLRAVSAWITIGALAALLLRGRSAYAAVPVFIVVVFGIALWLAQDRPQSLVIPLTVVLAWWLSRTRRGQFPSPWSTGALAIAWSNLHGSWVLIPAVLMLGAVGSWADGNRRLRRAGLGIAAAVVGGMVNPAAVESLLGVFRLRASTDHILEWNPTPIATNYAAMLGVLAFMLMGAWALSLPIAKGEILVGLVLVALGLSAIRNVPTALMLLSPIVVDRLNDLVGQPNSRRSSREVRTLYGLTGLLLVCCAIIGGTLFARMDPLGEAAPLRIAETLPEYGQSVRVLNDYGIGGLLVEFSPSKVEVGIDGRADRYAGGYADRYLDAQYNLVDWRAVVEEVDADVAVLAEGAALASLLETQGWSVAMLDQGFVLLIRP